MANRKDSIKEWALDPACKCGILNKYLYIKISSDVMYERHLISDIMYITCNLGILHIYKYKPLEYIPETVTEKSELINMMSEVVKVELSLKHLEEELKEHNIYRISKGVAVSRNHIIGFDRGILKMSDGQCYEVSEVYVTDLIEFLKQKIRSEGN